MRVRFYQCKTFVHVFEARDAIAWRHAERSFRLASLSSDLDLAERLYGVEGEGRVADWIAEQGARIDGLAFARLFSDHITLPGIALSTMRIALSRRAGSVDRRHPVLRTGCDTAFR
ncbi:hypothetical protein CEW89_00305 [Celeribacter ethanolicus]|uniref:Uncharacterized protein n=1 Tax=Celeribacter ethanolicus TaxID=1758178 RepID=A0A291G7P2_9RHOB|nr:hypothetical protein [Celeribacter ethanolicus]ATG46148.1 hypothetical protein CEW89_00305 [Celeribacter ethanolicus]TNE68088.1 MAG: hypothetical protein EP336_06085 [Paracoccaceae bacterium]